MIYVIIAILFFGLLVVVHELGHFATAKACGVKVNEFSVGMGPVLWHTQKGETQYSLRAVPFGGFCAMEGEDEHLDDPRAFTSAKWWKRILILCAGSFMNFVCGLLIIVLIFSDAVAFRAPIIDSFMEGCPYEQQDGLQPGDRFYKIDKHRVYEYSEVSEYLRSAEVHDIVVVRGGEKVTLKNYRIVPVEYEGYENKMYGFYFGYEEATFGTILKNSWYTAMDFTRVVWDSLQELVRGKVRVDDLSGPVGIVDMMAETGESAETFADAMFNIAYFGAFIAINLAIMNMLPIPALDGGRVFLLLVTLLIEAITRKKLNPKYEGYIHAGGMVLLLALMAFIMFHDIFKLVIR